MALITEIGKPREGKWNVIFLAVLKSLDVISDIAALTYRDSPVVLTELVKFLSLNIAFEAVYKLEKKSVYLTSDVK